MDDLRFDAVSRALGAAVSRRSGLAAIGSLLGLPVVAGSAGARRRKRKPQLEGPCGNGSRADNICTKDKQCCTGVCEKTPGETNVDGKGRCRCVKRQGKCTEDRNCCGGRACSAGVCGGQAVPPQPPGPTVPLGDPCVAGVSVCADNGTCQQQTGFIQTTMPNSGYFCSHEDGGSCTEPGTMGATECVGGWCSPGGDLCGSLVMLDVTAPCSAQTNTCGGPSIYYGQIGICAMSLGGIPVSLMSTADGTTACSSDTECGPSAVCVTVAPGSQCTESLAVSPGSYCVLGKYVCSVAGDCPVKASLTAYCPNTLCNYS